MPIRHPRSLGLCAALLLAAWAGESSGQPTTDKPALGPPVEQDGQGIFVLDGSHFTRAGELQVNVTNWGLIGSQPGTLAPYSDAPSAMWPAGSGVDYLFAAGLWVGAIKDGIPGVSTGQPETELLPSADPHDVIYEMAEGDEGSHRVPMPDADDDQDGALDEDPKDGYDNDGDGRIDEDFAAIGAQHLRCVMRDDTPLSQEAHPDHNPLGVEVTQEVFQWENPELEDAVVLRYTVRNVGDSALEGVSLGLYFDADIGPRGRTNVGEDDIPGQYEGVVDLPDGSKVPISIVYMYDCDGDDGQSPGYIGVVLFGRQGNSFPQSVSGTRGFNRTAPFDQGGEPKSDEERYIALRGGGRAIPTDCRYQGDWRLLIPGGSYGFLGRQSEVRFEMALVIGEGLDDLKLNAAQVAVAFFGTWYDADNNSESGRDGRENYVCERDYVPRFAFYQIPKACNDPSSLIVEADLDSNRCVWIDGDCGFEAGRGASECFDAAGQRPADQLIGCTGVNGREANVTWWVEALPAPPPHMRLWETHDRVHLFWDSRSERSVDPNSGLSNFEAYGLWRADRWTRPPGTSIATGPGSNLWSLLTEFDVVDSFQSRQRLQNGQLVVDVLPLGRNTGLQAVAYVPEILRPGSAPAVTFTDLSQLLDRILADHPELTIDETVRYRAGPEQLTPLGEQYPDLARFECCPAETDTLYWSKLGLSFHEYIDRGVHNGLLYFYGVTATTRTLLFDGTSYVTMGLGLVGQPRTNFMPAVPNPAAQTREERAAFGQNIYVVPNPATRAALADFSQLNPNGDDPTGVRVEFRNLPKAPCALNIYTLSGDLVETIRHDASGGDGSVAWNLVSRNGQEVVSGIYLYSVEAPGFSRVVGRFVIVR